MVENAEEVKEELQAANERGEPVFKISDDPRVSSIERFLRRTSLDELPKFINAIQGYMSLVRPRFPLRSEVGQYWTSQRWRLSMKLDLQHIDNWSHRLDMKFLAKTTVAVLMGTGH